MVTYVGKKVLPIKMVSINRCDPLWIKLDDNNDKSLENISNSVERVFTLRHKCLASLPSRLCNMSFELKPIKMRRLRKQSYSPKMLCKRQQYIYEIFINKG